MKKVKWSILSETRSAIFGLSILSIMLFHYFEDFLKHDSKKMALVQFGQIYNHTIASIGVDVFLLLSGMGLYYSMKKDPDLISFYKKRFSKILIPYAIWGGLFWLVYDLWSRGKGFLTFLKDFTFYSFWMEGQRGIWFIALIIVLYLVYPFIFRFYQKHEEENLLWTILFSFMLYALCNILKTVTPDFYSNSEIAILRVPIFLLGLVAGERAYHDKQITSAEWGIIICGLLIKIAHYTIWRHELSIRNFYGDRLMISWFAVSLTMAAALLIRLANKYFRSFSEILELVGAYSLELYLVHVTIRKLMNELHLYTRNWRNYAICLLLTIPVSIALKYISEKVKKKLVG